MTRPNSEDLRERALRMAEAGQTIRAIDAGLQISPSCVSKWRKPKSDTGGVKPAKIRGHKPRGLTGKWAALLRLTSQGALTTAGADEPVVPAWDYQAHQRQIRELQRLLGKKTQEAAILKEALELASD
jgi:transposase